MYHDFVVVKNFKHDMILGVDFLKARRAILDFESHTLVIGKTVHPLKEKLGQGQEKKEVNLVRLAEDADIFPRSDLQIRCFLAKKKPTGNEFVVTQLQTSPCFEDEPGILLPNAVVKVSKNKHIPWAIVNETGRHIHLRKGQVIGIASQYQKTAEVLEIANDSTPETEKENVLKSLNLEYLPSEQREILMTLLQSNVDLFVQKDSDLTSTHVTEMRINTQNNPPSYQTPRRPPLAYRHILEEQIQEMLNANVIRRSNSPWMSPVLLVPKKDGSMRFCVDFRKINAITVRPAASIPSAEDIFYALGNSKFRTSLDMKQGFWQIPIKEEDKEKTAFGTDAGVFEFNRMPFGLAGSPAVFQNCMNAILGDVRHFALAFVDDIIVFSETFDDHVKHLSAVFERLRKANLKLKISKCDFIKKRLNYLGHIISDEGISVDPDKVSVMENLKPPTNIREVRSFLGMTSYYRKYVPNFSKIAKPLTSLTRKNARFKWTDEAQKSFDFLKESLLQAPILAFPDITKPFKLYTDASQYALGAVLMQEQDGHDRAIQYVSHQFSPQKVAWPVIEREAFAIVYSLEKLRPIIVGTDITVYTDHKPLKHLFTSEMRNPRIQRWAIILGEYACKIEYISGAKNAAADMLSRLHNTPVAGNLEDNEHLDWKGEKTDVNAVADVAVLDNAVQLSGDETKDDDTNLLDFQNFDKTTMRQAQLDDKQLREIIDGIAENADDPQFSKFCMENELLYHIEKGTKTRPRTRMQLVVPSALKKMVLDAAHDGYLGGHLGIEKTSDKILQSYFWPDVLRDVVQYVQSCETCQRKKLNKERRPMQDMPMPSAPMEIVGIDTCGPFPVSDDGNKYVCTIVDHFSGWPEAYAIPDKSANTIAQLLLSDFIPRHGCPLLMISDQGTEYCNTLLNVVNKELGISRIRTSSYHPQSNGKTERFHRVMNEMIQKQISEDQTKWDQVLQPCLGAYRMSKNETTKYSPYFVTYGRDPRLPIDTILQPRLRYTGEEYVPAMFEQLHNAYSHVVTNIQQAREHNKTLISKTATPSNFKPGDSVYYFDPSIQPGDSTKLTLHWKNYFRIVSKIGIENYCIKNMHTGKTKIVHSENLRHRDCNDVWERTYDTVRAPPQVSSQPIEQPSRQQPLRAARLAYGDRTWYNDDWFRSTPQVPTTVPDVPSFASFPQIPPTGAEQDEEMSTQNDSPLRPSTDVVGPAVYSPRLTDCGEHGPPTQLSQSAPADTHMSTQGEHQYALRSRGPAPDPTLEGYRYQTPGSYGSKRQRQSDASPERTSLDKRPRVQGDIDCLSTETPVADVVQDRQPFAKADCDKLVAKPNWHPLAATALLYCAQLLFPSFG